MYFVSLRSTPYIRARVQNRILWHATARFLRDVGIWRGPATALVGIVRSLAALKQGAWCLPSRGHPTMCRTMECHGHLDSGPFRSIPLPLACFTDGPTTSPPLQIILSNLQFSPFQKIQFTTGPSLNEGVWASVNKCCHPTDFPISR
jgi:hypothetical protein